MPIVSLQNLLKHQQRAEGIPFSPGKCLIVGGLTRGDTWRGFFGISAENWVNLYSEVLHLKIGRAPKSGKFRWSSICYSGAFRMLSWSIIKRVRGPSSAWCFFLGWSSRASIWSCKSRGSSGGQGGCCRFGWFPWEKNYRSYAPRFGCKDLLLGKHLLHHFEQKFLELEEKMERGILFEKEWKGDWREKTSFGRDLEDMNHKQVLEQRKLSWRWS